MRSTDKAGKLLQDGHQVIVFDCGGDAARLAVSGLIKRYGCVPTALCDRDSHLFKRKIAGLEIRPPEELLVLYPDAYWLVTNFLNAASDIVYLEEYGVRAERIINYVAPKQQFSCRYLENYFHIVDHRMDFCCRGFGKLKSPGIDCGADINDAVKRLETLRHEIADSSLQGVACNLCSFAKEGVYPSDQQIRLINFSGTGLCNFKCCYCLDAIQKTPVNTTAPQFADIFAALQTQNLLHKDIHVQLDRGEIGVDPQRGRIFETLKDATVSVLTNASVFCEEIAEKLACGDAIINTSLDAGTREMFHKIKGVDAWERVCDTLRRYAEIARDNIVLKYIFMPGINDNRAEVDGFVAVCKELAGAVQISYDINCPEKIDANTKAAFNYLIQKLDSNGIFWYRNESVAMLEKETKK